MMVIMFVALFDLLLYFLAVLGVIKFFGSKIFHAFWRSRALQAFMEVDVVIKVITCFGAIFEFMKIKAFVKLVLAILELINAFFETDFEGNVTPYVEGLDDLEQNIILKVDLPINFGYMKLRVKPSRIMVEDFSRILGESYDKQWKWELHRQIDDNSAMGCQIFFTPIAHIFRD
jgi:hypothetical protein